MQQSVHIQNNDIITLLNFVVGLCKLMRSDVFAMSFWYHEDYRFLLNFFVGLCKLMRRVGSNNMGLFW